MIRKYISRGAFADLCFFAALLLAILAGLEIWSAHMVVEARLRRNIEFLSSVCPQNQNGERLISSAQTFSPAGDSVAPVSLRCVYSVDPNYGKSRKIVTSHAK